VEEDVLPVMGPLAMYIPGRNGRTKWLQLVSSRVCPHQQTATRFECLGLLPVPRPGEHPLDNR